MLTGIEPSRADEDRLKALGATAASSGSVALFHVADVTPEAVDAGPVWPAPGIRRVELTAADLQNARDRLSTTGGDRLDAVALGTPHFSATEFAKLAALLDDGVPFRPDCTVWISTSRAVLAEATERGYVGICEALGAKIVVDTCTYVTPVLDADVRTAMTTSGKWAWYAPANLGVDVVFGTLEECVASARAGRVVRDEAAWR